MSGFCEATAFLCGFCTSHNRGKDLAGSLERKTQQRCAVAIGVVLTILSFLVLIHQFSSWIKDGGSMHDRRGFFALCAAATTILSVIYTVYAVRSYRTPIQAQS